MTNDADAIDAEQRREAEAYVKELQASDRWAGRKIVTEIEPAKSFWPAEDYHQEYFARVGSQNPYCTFVVEPKVARFRKHFTDRLKKK